ncbi:Fic family protein [Chitinimonas arctica]|uniref:Fic family protein n=1 Tax=Chitinimonas arctica TaxID=2594795 RepID=A0A516SFX8_9NEIS|nr:Fic family protein [Chitinimonas arctica]QDQ27071.1 Fic family protein [Chitinimonas arctica]
MKNIAKAPVWDGPIDEAGVESLLVLARKYRAYDDKGRYLHWHEFRFRPTEDDRKVAWWAVKFARLQLLRPIGLAAEHGKSFLLCMPDPMQRILHRIDRMCPLQDEELFSDEAPLTVNRYDKLYYLATSLLEEAITSSQLEGASTTRRIAKEMLREGRQPRNKSEQMIFNNFELMQAVKENGQNPLSLELIKEFHRIAIDKCGENNAVPGELRLTDDVYIEDLEGEVFHTPPKATLLERRLERLCRFANMNHDGEGGEANFFLHPIVKATILHFMIGYEHPFADGNGRTARAIFYWHMLKCGYSVFEFISISRLLNLAPLKYFRAFLYVEDDDFDLTYFVAHQLDVVDRAVQGFLDYVKEKKRERLEFTSQLKSLGAKGDFNYRQLELLRSMRKHPGKPYTAKEVAFDYNVSANTAREDLKRIAQFGYAVEAQVAGTKERAYIALAGLPSGQSDLRRAV